MSVQNRSNLLGLMLAFYRATAVVQSTVLRLRVVCPSVMLVDQDHRFEILETNCMDN